MTLVLVNIGEYRRYGQIDEGLGVASVGLESIAAYLQKEGKEVKIIDQAMRDLDYEEVLREIIEQKPKIIGFNPLINTREKVGYLAARIKEQLPDSLVVIGGYDATFLSLNHPLYSAVDVIVRGKGEIALAEIADSVSNNQSLERIKGVSYRQKGKVRDNLDERAQALPVDDLPLPLRQNLSDLVDSQEPVSIYGSYGCNFRCKFCSTPNFYSEGRVERNLKDVLDEIEQLSQAGVRKFSFYDEDFFGFTQKSLNRATQIINKVKENGGIITFSFITTPGILQAEKYGFLKLWEGTVNRLYVGVEGGCQEALKGLGNSSCMNSSRNSAAISTVRKYNIGLQIGFIMFNAYSTFEELEKSARFLFDHDEATNAISFFHHLRPYFGTRMYQQLKEEGLLIEEEAEAEIDLHASLPYHFKADLNSGSEKMKNFAKAICPTSANLLVSESDRLNNEIYMDLVKKSLGKEIFSTDGSGIVEEYKETRMKVSQLNYDFFLQSLDVFRRDNSQDFGELRDHYLEELGSYVLQLRKIKKSIK